ncbi:hypothetical protein TIFTF001_032144 [Ficus carica]|uniref:Uncharacterized protein n=1 Tax=Ficus carica TaxID=3494 RepID=A0AA87YP25_FICCA|nr:hypothetical protein TIFTF001_048633 [Ficus carica]GMN63063.1 hypothetical protein TIFTF001_032144 [Ficus carica]
MIAQPCDLPAWTTVDGDVCWRVAAVQHWIVAVRSHGGCNDRITPNAGCFGRYPEGRNSAMRRGQSRQALSSLRGLLWLDLPCKGGVMVGSSSSPALLMPLPPLPPLRPINKTRRNRILTDSNIRITRVYRQQHGRLLLIQRLQGGLPLHPDPALTHAQSMRRAQHDPQQQSDQLQMRPARACQSRPDKGAWRHQSTRSAAAALTEVPRAPSPSRSCYATCVQEPPQAESSLATCSQHTGMLCATN